jgi:hypothetical protein
VSPKTQSPLRELCRGVWPVQDPETEQLRRQHIAERIVLQNRRLAQRSLSLRRQVWWVAAAALLGSLSLLWVLGRTPDSLPATASQTTPASARLVAGEASLSRAGVLLPLGTSPFDVSGEAPILVTRADQAAELRLSSDTALEVEGASEVGLDRRQTRGGGFEEHVRLRAGSVALRVPQLGERGKVAVETPDSWIEVHGTRFSVRWVQRAPSAPFTEVKVKEGKVLVRSRDGASRFLTAGEEWRSSSEQPGAGVQQATPAPVATLEQAAPPKPHAPTPATAAPASPAVVSASELAAQNRLLEGAELARKSGMPALALERLDTLMRRYPNAELAHNAHVQRFRLLWSMGRRAESANAARQYLERYPEGFGREEAQRYASGAEALKPGGTAP